MTIRRAALTSLVMMARTGEWVAARTLFALGASLLVSCQGQAEPAGPAVYVGAAAEPELSLALAVHGPDIAAYASGDDPHVGYYPGWFTGTIVREGNIALRRDGWALLGTWDLDGARGSIVTPDGTTLPWRAAPVRPHELPGLYTALDAGCATGVIVAPGAPIRGAWCSTSGEVEPVLALEPLRLVDGALTVEVDLDRGTTRLAVAPIRLPLR